MAGARGSGLGARGSRLGARAHDVNGPIEAVKAANGVQKPGFASSRPAVAGKVKNGCLRLGSASSAALCASAAATLLAAERVGGVGGAS